MTDTDFLMKHVFFTTRDFASATARSITHASHKLKTLRDDGTVVLITRGVFAQPKHPNYSISGAVPYLLGNEHGYVSFLTALHRHGIISQIPTTIQIATTGHSRKLKTSLGNFEFFKLNPRLMRTGVEPFEGKIRYNLASAEKALFDTFYLATRKGKRFAKLPELEWQDINLKKIRALIKPLPTIIREPMLKRISGLRRV